MTIDTPALWNSLPVPALLVDPEDRIEDINPAAESFLNASAKSMRGVPVWDKIAVDSPLEDAFLRARKHGTPLFVNDADIGTGDGPPIQGNLKISPVADKDGYMLFLITSRALAGRMTQSRGVKSSAKSAIGMAEMLAHEIKNPLAGITGAAQLLSMNLAPEDLELTDLIVEESRRIVKLLEQVEQFGNLSPAQKNPVNLHDVLDRARRSAMVGFGAHMVFHEDYDPSLPFAQGDADQLLQVVLNLLKNASEAADKKGTIRLRTYYDHSFRMRRSDGSGQALPLQVEVMDDGPGLPQDIKGDVFDPFVSGRENGTGLGLALVSKIISDHGGLINVDSVPGRTVFRISLPRLSKDVEKTLKET
ncbi:ATP-binding protein [Shimia thalassica]|jgi:two-component system nitrogen regulation sensor histidine kinase GlnL|uniref:two-component system sensor histidine kinase NtrB n=1 Tax=Shimia thalassica TaxID=1715693 RepID=UPI000C07826B|nr:ATP-binding protein [Shimia thalassica]PHO04156.1 PAS domain-containing sensor histidine kinase [Rhodobacteraceae bacterium 4F10]MBU2942011.1 PAS domain-containing protein [Shimia thalassica]MDO6478209.1 ATP-binding protein [Shimia thalassica]MDO6482972.1 ATP-binding protein [Shimia thalassica]MDO6503020.1 ATP-binding protein [Shimia thalassica]